MVFDHWQELPGDPLGENNMAADLVTAIRQRKGLPAGLPAPPTPMSTEAVAFKLASMMLILKIESEASKWTQE